MDWLALVGIVLGSNGLMSLIIALFQRHWKKKDAGDERITALVRAQKVSMRDRVHYLVKNHINEGYVTLEDKESIEEMFQAYKALGGNGHLDAAMEELDRLPVK